MTPTIEETDEFLPKFDSNGLIPCIAVDHVSGHVLMMAYMNEKSIQMTLKTKEAHYWSRSRKELWHKGATSGNIQKVVKMQIDCDQDCILMYVEMPMDNDSIKACHTGRSSCFYREIIIENDRVQLLKITKN